MDNNKNPQDFLITNEYYDSKIVGKYCEDRNPDLAFTAYKRAGGACDEELIAVTNKNYLFKMQAKYLVERKDENLWATVLNVENEYRQQLIDAVVGTALPGSTAAIPFPASLKATRLFAHLPLTPLSETSSSIRA